MGPEESSIPLDTRNWNPRECHPPPWLTPATQVLAPPQIASLYRALRKGLEDQKDEPGAADFYYGEMELRRQRATTSADTHGSPAEVSRAERTIVWLYWLMSGYALRASRALVALLIAIGVLALALHFWGFHARESYGQSLLFAAQSSISLLRAPTSQPNQETAAGQVIEIALRLLGPLLFGLALLSIRGRVKR